MPRKKPKPWTGAALKQLGRVPDSVLARRTGRTIKAVVEEREARKIGLPTGPRRWTAHEIKLLGKLNDHEVARRLRRTDGQVRTQRIRLKIPPFKPGPKTKSWSAKELRLLG